MKVELRMASFFIVLLLLEALHIVHVDVNFLKKVTQLRILHNIFLP